MTYDALVWLLVGLGIGVAASLMLLIGYAGLEQARLGRRLRRARVAAPVAEAAAVPARAVSAPAPSSQPAAPAVAARTVAVRPVAANRVAPKPVESAPAPVTVATPAAVTAPAAPPTQAPAVPAVAKVQSVEALFAEAFAHDRLTVAPEPDEQDPPRPSGETPRR